MAVYFGTSATPAAAAQIYTADTIHDWGKGQCPRVKDGETKRIVLKYIHDLDLGLESYDKPDNNVLYSDIENTFTEYVYTHSYPPGDLIHPSRTMISPDNTLDLSDPNTTGCDFKSKRDDDGCNTARVIMGSTAIPNSLEQNEKIGEQILKFFGADADDCQLHLIIDANSGKLNSNIYVYKPSVSYKVWININALNIADSAVTRVKAPNITYQVFPFNNTIDVDAINGTYDLTNWYLANKVLEDKGRTYRIFAYYTNAKPKTGWEDLPFHVSNANENGAYHISMRVYIQLTDGTKTPEWESSFVQKGPKNIQTTQGASVVTLAGLIKQIHEDKTTITMVKGTGSDFDLSPILNGMKNWLSAQFNPPLTPDVKNFIKRVLVSFIFDYKRSGDHEQVNSCKYMIDNYQNSVKPVKYVLSTGDQLCALWARLNRVPCIYHHAHFMDLYSFHEDKPSYRLKLFIKLLENALNLYTENQVMLYDPAGSEIHTIVRGHADLLPPKPAYDSLESVIKYRAYLAYIIPKMENYDSRLQNYYIELIQNCHAMSITITGWLEDVNLDTAPSVEIITFLKTQSIVPPDIFASCIAEIKKKYEKCGILNDDGWRMSIDRNNKTDIFGFTLGNHETLREKYNTLKNAHNLYRRKISESWSNQFLERSEIYKRERSLTDDSEDMINAYSDEDKKAREKWFSGIKTNYNRHTAHFINQSGNVLFNEIFVGTFTGDDVPSLIDEIRDMNMLFKIPVQPGAPQPVDPPPLDKPVWYIRDNCHNSGGLYYGISDITIFLEDTDEQIRINHVTKYGRNSLQENLEKEEFYHNHTGVPSNPPPQVSKWLMGAGAHSGGGKYEYTLTELSAPKFIDYIERIRSNIISDLNLDCVGEDVHGDEFKDYIIHSVTNIYLKYNQTDYAPADVYNLLIRISDNYPPLADSDNILHFISAQLYKYSILLYGKFIYAIDDNMEEDSIASRTRSSKQPRESHVSLKTRAAEETSRVAKHDALNKTRKSIRIRRGEERRGEGHITAEDLVYEDVYNYISDNRPAFISSLKSDELNKFLLEENDSPPRQTFEVSPINIIGENISSISAYKYLKILANGLPKYCLRTPEMVPAGGGDGGNNTNNPKTKNKLYTRKINRKHIRKNRKQTRKINRKNIRKNNRKQTRKINRKQTRKINRKNNRKHTRINKINNTRKMRKQTRKYRNRHYSS